MNRKEFVQKFFKGRAVSRPPFIPLLGSFLTKVNQVSVEELLNDSSTLASSIVNTQQLLGYDSLTLPIDTSVECEAFGAQLRWEDKEMPAVDSQLSLSDPLDHSDFSMKGRIPILIETVNRLVKVNGKDYSVFATVTGPLTILKNLYGEDVFSNKTEDIVDKLEVISQGLIQMIKSFGDEKVDGIIINEDLPLDVHLKDEFSQYYKPIFNVIKFYNISGILRIPPEVTTFEKIEKLPDCLIVSTALLSNASKIKTKGVAVDQSFWSQSTDPSELSEIWSKNNKRRLFLSTSHSLDLNLDLTELQEKTSLLCNEATWA
ncbi:uroporphyrinogen decarboxylase family protein [Niallia oryzisoli]|uniref:Uroporphyrinogen decarboxylase family protein n=1 Tax=Niallia oryzisoli TaxID=1737571 RepID=A0ABZ2C8C5_9BACI